MEFIDLKSQYQALKTEIDRGIHTVLDGASFILGKEVEQFENNLAEYLGVKHVISCSDGTAALQLIYMSYGIGEGDVVFCPDMTFIASIEPACLLGATPVFCDIDAMTYNISPESLKKQIAAVKKEGKLKPRAVVAVDFVGNPAEYDEIKLICKEHNLLLIEDAAQGMGAIYKTKRCGTLGDVGATSFFPSKPLGCYGDGGAVFTYDDKTAERLRSLRVHGRGIDKYHNIHVGINSRLDTLQAAILIPKLSILEEEMDMRKHVAEYYNEGLKDKYIVPYVEEYCRSSYAQYVVCHREKGKREYILQILKEKGIPAILYYPVPMHMLPVFEGINCYGEEYINATEYSCEYFGIPFSPYIKKADQDKIINVLKQI